MYSVSIAGLLGCFLAGFAVGTLSKAIWGGGSAAPTDPDRQAKLDWLNAVADLPDPNNDEDVRRRLDAVGRKHGKW